MATTDAPVVAEAHRETILARFPRWRFFFPVLLFLILTGFYWKLTLTKQYDWVWGPDLAQQVLPWFEEESRQLQHHQLPLWDPHMSAGQSMIGQAQPGTAYPLNWLLFLIPRTRGHIPVTALQWYFILIHYMAALFAYLLCRDLGCSRAGSLIGGLIFSLASFLGSVDWPQMASGGVWAPLVFLFLLRAARGYRPMLSAVFAGTSLGMSWLAGHHQAPIYITLTSLGLWTYFALRRGAIDWNIVKLAAIFLVFLVFVGALQILPAQEYGSLAKRWAGADHELRWDEAVPYYVHQQFSLGAMSLLGILVPGFARHTDPFLGVVALSLALFAVAIAWQNSMVRLFAAIALAGLVYALGFNSVFHGFLYAVVPFVEKARVPAMAVLIWSIGSAVLAAFGLDAFVSARDTVWARRLPIAAALLGVLIYLMALGTIFAQHAWAIDDRVAITALVALLMAGVLQGWRTANLGSATAIALLLMLMLLELGNFTGYTFPHRSDKEQQSFKTKVTGNADIAQFLHQQPGLFRVEELTDQLNENWAVYHDLDAIKTMAASIPLNLGQLEAHTWQTRQFLGIRYTVSDKPPYGDSREVFTGQSGLKVFENPGAYPRLWTVHETIKGTPEDVRRTVNDHLDDLRKKALIAGTAPALETCAEPDETNVIKYEAEQLRLGVRMRCKGLVILSDNYFPGWKADLDGQPVPILEVNACMRGVVVPAGKHEIAMRYRPRSVYLGAAMTFLGWGAALGLAIFARRRKSASEQ